MERSEVRGRPFPDFAVLHPGYGLAAREFTANRPSLRSANN